MRLICPNCDAHYEVPLEVIPPEGRDVQCSSCGKTWMQYHPDHPPEAEAEPEVVVPRRPVPKSKMDAGIEDILRQEAKREEDARAEERENLETQPGLGLDAHPPDPVPDPVETPPETAQAEAVAAAALAGSRRDLLPDIEEINSTLRSSADRSRAQAANEPDAPISKPAGKRGFRVGLLISLCLALGLILIYGYAPRIAQSMPATDPYISRYVTQVDRGRLWINARLSTVQAWLDETAEAQQSR